MAEETVTVALESNEHSDEIEVPVALVDLLGEANESATTVVGDLAMLGLAQQIHGVVHHSQGDVDEDIEATEELTMELFEQRFGRNYAEVTGHSH
jgi:hypothetical protein